MARKTTAIVKAREAKAIATTISPDEALNEWLSEHRSPNTRAAYYRDLVDFCKTVFNAKPEKALRRFFSLDEVAAGIKVTQFKQLLRERGLSPASINRKLSALRAFIDHARRRGIVNWRIKDLIKGEKQRTDPKERIRLRLPATTADGLVEALQRLFFVLPKKGVKGLRDRAIIVLMALHGLRRVEVARLSLSDLIEEKGLFSLRVFGKGDKIRVIPLREDTTELLKRYLSALKKASIEPIPDDYGVPLFVSLRKEKGKRLTLQQINNIVDEAFKAAGLKRKGLSCHSLRHSFGTIAATKRGVPIPDLAAYMGHSNISTTSLYAHAVGVVNPSAMIKELRAI
jgi:site-specific recombinase XerD